MARIWAPKDRTPIARYYYKQDRVSAISALAVLPKRRRVALYLIILGCAVAISPAWMSDRSCNTCTGICEDPLSCWDWGTIHRRKEVQQWITAHPRLHVEEFTAYAPELNPAVYVWAQADRTLANSTPIRTS